MNLLIPLVTVGSQAAISAGLSKLFDISKPKAMAMHAIGWTVAATVLQNIPWTPQGMPQLIAYTATVMCASHFAGKALAKQVCNVDVTAMDVLNIGLGSIVAATPILVCCASLISNINLADIKNYTQE